MGRSPSQLRGKRSCSPTRKNPRCWPEGTAPQDPRAGWKPALPRNELADMGEGRLRAWVWLCWRTASLRRSGRAEGGPYEGKAKKEKAKAKRGRRRIVGGGEKTYNRGKERGPRQRSRERKCGRHFACQSQWRCAVCSQVENCAAKEHLQARAAILRARSLPPIWK